MKLIALGIVATSAFAELRFAGELKQPVVSIALHGGPEVSTPTVSWAKSAATRILALAGVHLDWCTRPRNCQDWEGRIIVTLLPSAPVGLPEFAMAEAQVFGGRSIRLYADRLQRHDGALAAWKLLGHVMAHEVVHLLQAVDRHSSSGLMKSRWDANDFRIMSTRLLPTAEEDLEFLWRGLARRRLQVAETAWLIPTAKRQESRRRQ